jgi:hypothetical protein
MSRQRLLTRFPRRRISPLDGMAVTADIWREAHDYHLAQQRLLTLSLHGAGIVTGLEVIASDPPSQRIYILPGIAIDPDGNMIVLPEPVAYDLSGLRDGKLHILITYEESRPQPLNGKYGDQPFYIHTGYNIEAVMDSVESPQIEIARIDLNAGSVVRNAANSLRPAANEIDMRRRLEIGPMARQSVSVGVAYLSRMGNSHGRGLLNLARAASQQGTLSVGVDDGVDLAQDLAGYTLIALVAKDRFQLDVSVVNALFNFTRNGGTLFIESCHREGSTSPASDPVFTDLLGSFGARPATVGAGHELLQNPHLFSHPPLGYETSGTPALRESAGIIFSSYDYGCLWAGDQRSGPADRETIRSAVEWGQNLIHYAMRRRQRHTGKLQEPLLLTKAGDE